MWAYLIAVPFLSFWVIFQSAVTSRIPLLEGQVDLVLLAVVSWSLQDRVRGIWFWGVFGGLVAGFVTALPFGLLLIGYLIVIGLALFLKRRVWKVSFLSMIASVFAGTLIIHFMSFVAVSLQGTPLAIVEVLNFVVLPSLLLNLLFAVPMYIVVRDIARWLYPEELKI
jgi:rod shape-determining protein MreD